jgi:transcriptional regulator with XRE-family HTH domain
MTRTGPTLRSLTLGALLKGLRTANGWTLKEMSERTGIPFSTLSKVEHDKLTLTYDKLLQIAERLHIRMSDLFAQLEAEPEPGAAAPVLARRSIGDRARAVQVSTPNYDYYYLCPELRRKRMLPVLTRIRARSLADFGDFVRHSGEEFIYVLEGCVAVHTEYYEPVTLQAGEALYIDSDMGHAYVLGEGCDEALILGACSSPEQARVSATA